MYIFILRKSLFKDFIRSNVNGNRNCENLTLLLVSIYFAGIKTKPQCDIKNAVSQTFGKFA